MESNVTVHRVVRDKKKPGQYIEPHSHPFFTICSVWRVTSACMLQRRILLCRPAGLL